MAPSSDLGDAAPLCRVCSGNHALHRQPAPPSIFAWLGYTLECTIIKIKYSNDILLSTVHGVLEVTIYAQVPSAGQEVLFLKLILAF
jgi:hypothetical protein